MNKDILTIKKAQKMSLSKEEKHVIWAMIEKRGQVLPAPSPFVEGRTLQESSASLASQWVFFQRKVLVGMAAVVLVISGGVSTLAESALPGESLYAVKINVNEKIQAVLAFSDKDKASVEAALAVKRLEEVKVLAQAGSLNPQTEELVKTHFAKHSQNLEQQLQKLDARGDISAVVQIGGRYEHGVASAYQTFVDLAYSEGTAADSVHMMAAPMAANSRLAYDSTEIASGTALVEASSAEVESNTTFKVKTKQTPDEQGGLLGFAEEIRKVSSKTSLLLHDSEQKLRMSPGNEKRSHNRE